MNREQLIKKAQKIEAKYYEEVRECEKFYGYDHHRTEQAKTEWGAVLESLSELLELTQDEYFEIFFGCSE